MRGAHLKPGNEKTTCKQGWTQIREDEHFLFIIILKTFPGLNNQPNVK